MKTKTIIVSQGEGRLRMELIALATGQGLQLVLTGGEKPHIGATVMCIPRESLTGQGISCDSWVVPVPGHKDNVIAKQTGEFVCKALNQVVVVTAGVHINKASSDELKTIEENTYKLANKLLLELKPNLK